MKITQFISAMLITMAITACGGSNDDNSGDSGGDTGSATGGSTGTVDGGTDGNADGGTDGNSDGGTDGNADGGTDGNADGGTDGSADGGTAENGDNGFIGPVSQFESNFPRGDLGDNDSVPAINCTETVNSTSALETRLEGTLNPGDTICIADGTYSDLRIDFIGTGTADNPITLAAENPGEVTFTGETGVTMSGEYLVLQGIIFRDGTSASSDFLKTRGGNNLPCNYCRITEISIIDIDSGQVSGGRWLQIYGTNNRIDHSWFSGKTTTATLIEIVRQSGFDGEESDYAQIDHNYFGNRAPTEGKAYAESSDNEFEGIRIGTSDTQNGDSFSVVEYNYFEAINGEAEVISNKSGSNTIRYNTIRNSYGSLTTRHGANATIEGNYIIGDDHPFAGGLRIIDENHSITNNYIAGARYLNTLFHGGIVIHNSDGSSDSGYQQVQNILLANNTVVDSVNSLNVAGGRGSTNPVSIYLVNNIIAQGIGPVITQAENGLPAGSSTISGNTFYGQDFSDDDLNSAAGITFAQAELTQDELGIWRPSNDGSALVAVTDAAIGDYSYPALDMDGQNRTGTTQQGADHISDEARTVGVLNSYDVGPINYRPEPGIEPVKQFTIANHDFDRGDDGSWTLAGAVITAEPNETFSRARSGKITALDGKISQVVTLEENKQYTLSAFAKGQIALGVDIDGSVTTNEVDESEYRFTSVTFNSGSSTSATIFAEADKTVDIEFIKDRNLTEFRSNSGSSDVWITEEGDAIGDVGSSSDSSSSSEEGSAKIGYTKSTHANGSPKLRQTANNILPDTDYTFSFYLLVKSDSINSGVTLQLNIEGNASNLIENQTISYQDLPEESEKNKSFRLYTTTFNSGSNTSLDIVTGMTPRAITFASAEEVGDLSSDTKRANELRVDEFSLSYEGVPTGDPEAYFDSFRLVAHGNIESSE